MTSTEILMGIRHTLEQQMRDPRWPAELGPGAQRLRNAIKRAL